MGMIQTFKQAWKIPEMKKKLIFTLIMLIGFRFGSNIPVPGVNKELLAQMFNANDAGLLGLFDMFTGGSFSQFTVFALGIGPYITASIVLQLLTVAIPALEELAKQGEEGRKKINKITRYTAIGLALIQGIGYTFGSERIRQDSHSSGTYCRNGVPYLARRADRSEGHRQWYLAAYFRGYHHQDPDHDLQRRKIPYQG